MKFKKTATVLTILAILIAPATAQNDIRDGFEDGDYTNDPSWTTSTEFGEFSVNSGNALTGSYYLYADWDERDSISTEIVNSPNTLSYEVVGEYSGKKYDIKYFDSTGDEVFSIRREDWTASTNVYIGGSKVCSVTNDWQSVSEWVITGVNDGSITVTHNENVCVENYAYKADTPTEVYMEGGAEGGSAVTYFDEITYSGQPNQAPTINDAYTVPDPVEVGNSFDIVANATDPDGNLDTVTAEIFEGNDSVKNVTLKYDQKTGLYRKNNAYKVAIADYRIEVIATDTEGASDTFIIPQEQIEVEREPAEKCDLFGCIIKDFQASIEGIVNLEFLQKTPSEIPLWKFLVLIAGLYIGYVLIDENSY